MPLVSDAVILSDIAAMQKQNASAPPQAYWAVIVALQHALAYQQMVAALAARGWSIAAITTSDQAPVMERAHSLYLSISDGGGIEGLSEKTIKAFDMTERFATVLLTQAGAPIIPDLAAPWTPCTTGHASTHHHHIAAPWDDDRHSHRDAERGGPWF